MSINTSVNYPLLRDLREMGLLTSDAAPLVSGPFRIKTEAFAGDSSGATKTLAETPLVDGVFSLVTIATAAGTDNTLVSTVEDTDWSISDETLTYETSAFNEKQVLIQYAY